MKKKVGTFKIWLLAIAAVVAFSVLPKVSSLATEDQALVVKENKQEAAERVVNAGSVFLGSYTPESAGDYASGTNHTLPTNGYATAYSGVNLDSYHRKITFQELTPQGVRAIGPAVELMAAGEHLDAHRNAMTVRLESIKTEMK